MKDLIRSTAGLRLLQKLFVFYQKHDNDTLTLYKFVLDIFDLFFAIYS